VLNARAVELASNTAAAASESATAAAAAQQEKTAAAAESIQQLTGANAALITANNELEKKAAANAQTTAQLSKELRTALSELDETLPDTVSVTNSYHTMLS
jgi:hypothetical protein